MTSEIAVRDMSILTEIDGMMLETSISPSYAAARTWGDFHIAFATSSRVGCHFGIPSN